MFAPFAYVAYQNLSDSSPNPNPNGLPEPDFSLTDEQAVGTFETLYTASTRAIQQQDPSILPNVLTDGGPIHLRAQQEIKQLKADGIVDNSEIEIVDSSVKSSSSSEIVLDVTFHLSTCFQNDQGEDVTKGPRAIEQRSEWTLKLENDRWQLHQGVLKEDRVLGNNDVAC